VQALYKVIVFKCGCKYIWLTGTERRHKVCPEHNRPTGSYISWCRLCGKRVESPPRAGYRQKYCSDCKIIWQRQQSRNWYAANPEYFKARDTKKRGKQKTEVETQKDEAARQIREWAESCRAMFRPPMESRI